MEREKGKFENRKGRKVEQRAEKKQGGLSEKGGRDIRKETG